MTRQDLIAYCLTFPDAYEDYPFGSAGEADCWTAMRHLKSKKTFAFLFERGGLFVNVKCEPERAELLRQLFDGVTPAYHMNKNHWNWNSVRIGSDVPDDVVQEMIDRSYRLTTSGK